MKYFIQTFGCQMNTYDSDVMGKILTQQGYSSAQNLEQAQVVIINTCSVRQHAEHRAWSHIGELRELKEVNPDLIIVVAGCMAERLGERTIKNRFPHVDLVIGAKHINNFAGEFNKILEERGQKTENRGQRTDSGKQSKLKDFVTIMRGCANYCSYCIVPYVRGNPVSRKLEDIIEEIKNLASGGCKEVTLLGQNVNAYYEGQGARGKGQGIIGEGQGFVNLLEEVNKIDGIERIRFMTSHPKDMTEDIISAVANLDKVCEHIHLPVQSGSDKILENMNRGYTRDKYLKLAENIKNKITGVTISTDIIVGFPGETERDFCDTLDLVNEVKFDAAFTFKYSPRPGTKADELGDTVPIPVKKERLEELTKLQEEIVRIKNAQMVGKTVEILVVSEDKENPSVFSGRTRTDKVVKFKGEGNLMGKLFNVKITDSAVWALKGEVTDKI